MEASVCIRMCTEEKAARTQQLTLVPHEPSACFDNKSIPDRCHRLCLQFILKTVIKKPRASMKSMQRLPEADISCALTTMSLRRAV